MKHWLFYYQVHETHNGEFIGRYSCRKFTNRLYPVPMNTKPYTTEDGIISEIYDVVHALASVQVNIVEMINR